MIDRVWIGPKPFGFLGTGNIEFSLQPKSVNVSETFSVSQNQAELWDLRQKHDVCLSENADGKLFRSMVINTVVVMVLGLGAKLIIKLIISGCYERVSRLSKRVADYYADNQHRLLFGSSKKPLSN